VHFNIISVQFSTDISMFSAHHQYVYAKTSLCFGSANSSGRRLPLVLAESETL